MGWNGTDRNRGLLPNTVRNSAEESWSSKPVVGSSNLSGPAKQYCLLAQWQSNRPIIDRHKFDSCTGNQIICNGVYGVVVTLWIVIPASPVRTWLDTPELLGNGEMVSHEILIPVF